MRPHLTGAAIAIAAACLAAPTLANDGFPLTIQNCDITVKIPAPPEHVVVYSASVHNLLALGLEDRILGASGSYNGISSDVPWHDALARVDRLGGVGSEGVPSEEAVLVLEPDLVYSSFYSYLNSDETATRETLESFGIPSYLSPVECQGQTFATAPFTFETLFGELEDIATIFGVTEETAPLIADYRARVEAVTSIDHGFGEVSLLWYYAATNSPWVAGCCGSAGMLTKAIGAQNAYGDDSSVWTQGVWETIAERDPDVIVLAELSRGGEGDTARSKIEFMKNDPLLSTLTAVQNDRFIILPGAELDTSVVNVYTLEALVTELRAMGFGN